MLSRKTGRRRPASVPTALLADTKAANPPALTRHPMQHAGKHAPQPPHTHIPHPPTHTDISADEPSKQREDHGSNTSNSNTTSGSSPSDSTEQIVGNSASRTNRRLPPRPSEVGCSACMHRGVPTLGSRFLGNKQSWLQRRKKAGLGMATRISRFPIEEEEEEEADVVEKQDEGGDQLQEEVHPEALSIREEATTAGEEDQAETEPAHHEMAGALPQRPSLVPPPLPSPSHGRRSPHCLCRLQTSLHPLNGNDSQKGANENEPANNNNGDDEAETEAEEAPDDRTDNSHNVNSDSSSVQSSDIPADLAHSDGDDDGDDEGLAASDDDDDSGSHNDSGSGSANDAEQRGNNNEGGGPDADREGAPPLNRHRQNEQAGADSATLSTTTVKQSTTGRRKSFTSSTASASSIASETSATTAAAAAAAAATHSQYPHHSPQSFISSRSCSSSSLCSDPPHTPNTHDHTPRDGEEKRELELPLSVRRRSSSSLATNLLGANGRVSAIDKTLVCEIYGVSVLCGRCSTCVIRTMLHTCDTWYADKMSPNQQCKFLTRLLKQAPDDFLSYAAVLISPLVNRDVLYSVGNRSSAANNARQAMAISYLHRRNTAARPTTSPASYPGAPSGSAGGTVGKTKADRLSPHYLHHHNRQQQFDPVGTAAAVSHTGVGWRGPHTTAEGDASDDPLGLTRVQLPPAPIDIFDEEDEDEDAENEKKEGAEGHRDHVAGVQHGEALDTAVRVVAPSARGVEDATPPSSRYGDVGHRRRTAALTSSGRLRTSQMGARTSESDDFGASPRNLRMSSRDMHLSRPSIPSPAHRIVVAEGAARNRRDTDRTQQRQQQQQQPGLHRSSSFLSQQHNYRRHQSMQQEQRQHQHQQQQQQHQQGRGGSGRRRGPRQPQRRATVRGGSGRSMPLEVNHNSTPLHRSAQLQRHALSPSSRRGSRGSRSSRPSSRGNPHRPAAVHDGRLTSTHGDVRRVPTVTERKREHRDEALEGEEAKTLLVWFASASTWHRLIVLRHLLTFSDIRTIKPVLDFVSSKTRLHRSAHRRGGGRGDGSGGRESDACGDDGRMDVISNLPSPLAKYILGFLDFPDLMRASQVSDTWRALAGQVMDDQTHRQDARDLLMDMQKSSAGNRHARPVDLPYTTDDGETVLHLVEKNVFCGPSTLIMCDGMDDTRVVGYAGGNVAVTGSSDKVLRFYDINSGFVMAKVSGHAGSIRSVSVAPQHNLVLSGSYDSSARLWDLTTHKCLGILRGHKSTVTAVHLDDTGGFAATGSKDRRFIVWEAPTRKMIKSLATPSSVVCVHVSHGHACCGVQEGMVMVVEAATGRKVKTFKAHEGAVQAIAVDDHFVATGGADRFAHLWSLQPCTTEPLVTFRHVGAVTSVHLLFCRTVTASDDGKVRVWSNIDGSCAKIFRGNSASRPIRELCMYSDHVMVVNTTTTLHFQLFAPDDAEEEQADTADAAEATGVGAAEIEDEGASAQGQQRYQAQEHAQLQHLQQQQHIVQVGGNNQSAPADVGEGATHTKTSAPPASAPQLAGATPTRATASALTPHSQTATPTTHQRHSSSNGSRRPLSSAVPTAGVSPSSPAAQLPVHGLSLGSRSSTSATSQQRGSLSPVPSHATAATTRRMVTNAKSGGGDGSGAAVGKRQSSPNAWVERRQRPSQADVPLPSILQETMLAGMTPAHRFKARGDAHTTSAWLLSAPRTLRRTASGGAADGPPHSGLPGTFDDGGGADGAGGWRGMRGTVSTSSLHHTTSTHGELPQPFNTSGQWQQLKQARGTSTQDAGLAHEGETADGTEGENRRTLRTLRFGRQFAGQWRTLLKVPELGRGIEVPSP